MKCTVYYIQRNDKKDWLFEMPYDECESISEARKLLNLASRLTKKESNNCGWLYYYEIRYNITKVGYDTTNERWYLK